jgi:hypothetical protein
MTSIWLAACIFVGVASLCLSPASPDEPAESPNPAADPMIGAMPGQVREDNGLKMKFV